MRAVSGSLNLSQNRLLRMNQSITKLLVANRGEIACRVHRTAEKMGIPTVAVFTESDADSPHRGLLGESYLISNYLATNEVIDVAKKSGANAIHPGYGFLSENPDFQIACEKSNITFVGPSAKAMVAIGDKSKARETAKSLGIPISEGLGPFTTVDEIKRAVVSLGTPLMLKAAAGGGGKGMKKILDLEGIEEKILSSQRESEAAFGDNRLIVERYIYPARHIEVQVFGDGNRCIALGERECSLQRRHQKLIEESPSSIVSEDMRKNLSDAAKRICESVGYKNAGTCEFLVGPDDRFYFLEVNARLQVEHPVTEMCTGLDLVELQLRIAMGEPLPEQSSINRKGHAIEARLCAEDPWHDFLPSAGPILKLEWAENVRVDSGVGNSIGTNYDSMVAKLISFGEDREEARLNLIDALQRTVLLGVATNQAFLIQLLESGGFVHGQTFTTTVDENGVGERPMPFELPLAAALVFSGTRRQGEMLFETAGNWRMQ